MHVNFVLNGFVTNRNNAAYFWNKTIAQFIEFNGNKHSKEDFTSINGAIEIARQMNIKVARTTITKLIADNDLGWKLNGKRGQWAIHKTALQDLLQEKIDRSRHSL